MVSLNLTFDDIINVPVASASSVSDWNTFFDLPTYGEPFTGVTVSGNTVILDGGSNITLKELLFSSNAYLISFDDDGCVVLGLNLVFSFCYNLTSIILPNIVSVGDYFLDGCSGLLELNFPSLTGVSYSSLSYCSSVTSINLPNLIIAGNNTFEGNISITYIDLPSLITAGEFCFYDCSSLQFANLPNLTTAGIFCFSYCTSLTTINIPSCTDLGGTVGDNNVFSLIAGNTITLTVPPGLMTCNSGNPDGDIQYLQANNTVTINDSPFINPNALNLQFDFISSANLLVGDASVVGDWNTFFDLPTYGTPFSAVTISASTVQLFGGSNITMTNGGDYSNNLFSNNLNIIEVDDQLGCITSLGDGIFYNADNLQIAKFNSAITAGNYVFGSDSTSSLSIVEMDHLVSGTGVFYDCPNILSISLPSLEYAYPATDAPTNGFFTRLTNCTTFGLSNLIVAGNSCFSLAGSLTSIDLPNLISIGSYCFSSCSSLTTINIPSCTDLGGTTGNDDVFQSIFGNTITLTVPEVLMTCNSGNPDGDIQYLQVNNTVTVIEVTPTPSPTPTPTPTSGMATTPTPTPSSTVPPTPTPSPTFIPYSGVGVNQFYEYTIEMLGSFSGGTAPSGAIVPHPIMIGNDGIPYAQLNAVQIGGFNGLNN